ncbi:MAG: glycosyltransferase [Caldisericia bacterium]|nr:glycosyltransferase [Caldisericia bacterium]
MKKILFVSFFSPPIGSGGGERVIKLIKYIKGYEKYLLTSDYPTYKYRDDTSRIPEDTKVIRVKFKDPRIFIPKFIYRFLKREKGSNETDILERYRVLKSSLLTKIRLRLFIPDDKIRWVKDSKRVAKNLVEKQKIDVVITSGPPHSTHLIGLYLKRKLNIKWVMDLRDLWSENPFVEYPPSSKIKNRKIEEKCLKETDLIIVVTESFKKVLLKEFKFLDEKKIKVVYGGFDKKDFEVESKEFSCFSISYIGSFYSLQTPVFFFKAFKELIEEDENFRKEAKIYILSPFEENTKKIVDEMNLVEFVNISGFLPHKEAMKYLLGSKLLFLFLGRGGEDTVPQKTFEYLGSGKRIIALVPDGECKEILLKCGVIDIVEPDNIENIKRTLKKIYNDYLNGVQIKYNNDEINKFSMENISEKFIESLKDGGVL